MAEVTGQIGDQPVQLNNAATEATLKQLLAAMTAIANNTGKDKGEKAKSAKQLEAELKKLATATAKQTEAAETSADKQKRLDAEKEKQQKEQFAKYAKAAQENINEMNAVKNGMAALGSKVIGVAGSMTNMLSSLANLGDSLTSTAQVFSQIPVVGGVLSGMFGAVAGAAEKTYEAFKKTASVGANFGGSMTEMMDAATGAGMTFDSFTSLLAKSGQNIALLGGDSEAGARRLAALGKEIKGSPLAKDLARLGYSTEAINEGMASYAGQLAKTGSLQGMSNAQLIAGTGAYLKDLDSLTKLTGKNKQELEADRNARLKDAQFRNIMSKMDVDSQKNLQNLMDSIPAEHQEGMKEIIATGTATSEAGKKALAFLPDSAKNMMQLNQQIRTTGKMGATQAAQINAAYQTEVKNFTKSGVADNMAQFGDEASKRFYVGAMDAAAREKNLAQVTGEQQKAAAERAAKEKELKDKQLDPASMEEYKNKIAATSNEFTKFLANSGMLDIMMEAFATLVDIVELVVVPAFQFVVDNFDEIAIVGGILFGAFMALKGIIFVANAKLAYQTLLATKAAVAAGANTLATTGATVGMAKAGIAATIMSLPFLKITLVVGALVGAFLLVKKIFTELYDAGWDLGTTFEAIGDKIYDVFVLGFKDLMTSILAFLGPKFGGISKDEAKSRRENIAAERKDLKDRENARDAQRAANRLSRDTKQEGDEALAATVESTEVKEKDTVAGRKAARAKEKELDATEKARKAKEAETAAVTAATATPDIAAVNLSNPQKMFDSMVRRQQGTTAGPANQPGAQSASGGGSASSTAVGTGLGAVAEKYESAGRGSGTVGYDKMGGTSYGKKQISSKTGAMTDYLKFLEKSGKGDVAKQLREAGIEKDTGSTTGKAVDVWKQLAASGALGDSEGEFLKTQSFDVAKKGIKDKDLQARIDGSRGLQEMLYSTAVQHGPGGAMKILNSVFKKGMSDEDLVKAVYKERGTKFGGSTAEVQAGVAKRFVNEEADIMGLLKTKEAGLTAAPATASTSTVPTTAAAQAAVTPASTASTQAAADARTAAAAADSRRTDRPQTATPGPRQETPESLLASLNTKMDQLIAINNRLATINDRQLSVQKGLSGDLFTYGA